MADGGGPSYNDLVASGAIGSRPNVQASQGNPSHSGGKMLPIEGASLDGTIIHGDLSATISTDNADSMFASLNAGGGALGQGVVDAAAAAVNHHGAQEARGDNIALEDLGKGERQSPPNVQGDLQMNKVGMIGQNQGASH